MTSLVFHSDLVSPYLWAVTHAATEKGVSWSIETGDPPLHRTLHPFGKMPVLRHGDVTMYEASAIAIYIDRAFSGPPLQPADALGQAEVARWMSVVNAYIFPLMNRLVKERFVVPRQSPDEEWIAAALEPLTAQVSLIADVLACRPFLVGESLTLADSFLLPHLHLATLTPEGSDAIDRAPAAKAWLERMRERPSFGATDILRQRT
jgi:glutathione S-transferase